LDADIFGHFVDILAVGDLDIGIFGHFVNILMVGHFDGGIFGHFFDILAVGNFDVGIGAWRHVTDMMDRIGHDRPNCSVRLRPSTESSTEPICAPESLSAGAVLPGVDVMITIFCDFRQWRFSQKPML
jgi:hypothetical protein